MIRYNLNACLCPDGNETPPNKFQPNRRSKLKKERRPIKIHGQEQPKPAVKPKSEYRQKEEFSFGGLL